ncbi:MAG: Sec-independent protein translocase, TatC subunit [Candidatus Roizmanbacteria bacterium GW2011_GWC2_37_13]|uniref:Sec-independent protein translocase, TatC subunit n=1 Tax=Candidatus Roizmanbacteria bacterium GW2011_GWC2_37_13 TaxID=1618486 RepID=A0A0G0G7N3_9BACT|nr:MAG: component of the twin-arginine pre-protein translocation pathway, sec-independent protein translocase protein TatC [Candidatus Roizmanbacteria bacterium GW2011_GWC1_37_12]KKQ26062.1 MAG: Sec-independent protein translocase, TatC subunit [Candidatus Roizmanbacteria bacterium GW2011_GWC2_37_13]
MKKTSPTLQTAITQYMPYLIEIRKRLFFVLAVFFIAAAVGFIYFEPFIKLILKFYNLKSANIVFTSPFQFINLAVNSGITFGLIIAFPLIIYQLVSFLKPALKSKEYISIITAIPISFILFIIGFSFGGWIMKFVVNILSQQSSQLRVQNLWDIEIFIKNIFMTSLWLAVIFQFPVVITPLIRLNVVKYQSLVSLRPMIYLALLIFTMSLPPTDILTDFLIFFPLAFLFEVTLLLNRRYR